MQDYETRKHFEAALTDLAKMFNIPPKKMRENFKWLLIQKKIIISSTLELDDERLKGFASQISIYKARMDNTPPNERGLWLENILKIDLSRYGTNDTPRN